MKVLDCTLRDGGYYNNWSFPPDVVEEYLSSMAASGVDIVELGLRSLFINGFKGASGYTTDSYLDSLDLPESLKVAVMVNASELVDGKALDETMQALFPRSAVNSKVDVVRVACHVHEFKKALRAVPWLKERGYQVGFNLMQVADRSQAEIEELAESASGFDIDALYFADSMGSMKPADCVRIVSWLRSHWKGELGIHTHDNMGLALSNTLAALENGVTWLDATVTGMGRGPGNARTEELVIEISERRGRKANLIPLMSLIRRYFQPLKNQCGWGSNPYYYLSGKYGIHPTYIQEMLGDSRYDEEDILAVIEHLRAEGGSKFSANALGTARQFYSSAPKGTWSPGEVLEGRDVLLLGAGPGVANHREALQRFIEHRKPVVLALNTQENLDPELVDFRVACHPVRLLADCEAHVKLPHPLITPYTMLPEEVKGALAGKDVLDYGLSVQEGCFEFSDDYCKAPSSLVVAYALSVASSGKANRVVLAGFDGYGADDPRSQEMQSLLEQYQEADGALPLVSITPTRYGIHTESVYAL